ncbi:MAG: enoyl-CoA hydratase/isomerase family protein [Bacteroidales bacterium]|nr:enoyl-CoA hydratase/isomerase family protein [Bacteroidales bacterium]
MDKIQQHTILVEHSDQVTTISLNRPEVHNAMNEVMISELTLALEEIASINIPRIVVLRGNGKSFCAGADLNYMKGIAGFGFEENLKDGQKLAKLFLSIYQCPVPVVALVHGSAFGGANGLLAACDIVIAEENTKFAFSEVKLGIAPATIAPFVIKRIGEFGAKELMLTGKRFSADDARHWHLVNFVVPEEKMEEQLHKVLSELWSAAPGAVSATKKLIGELIQEDDLDKNLDHTSRLIAQLRASEEGQEGMAAFLEKRKAAWNQTGKN